MSKDDHQSETVEQAEVSPKHKDDGLKVEMNNNQLDPQPPATHPQSQGQQQQQQQQQSPQPPQQQYQQQQHQGQHQQHSHQQQQHNQQQQHPQQGERLPELMGHHVQVPLAGMEEHLRQPAPSYNSMQQQQQQQQQDPNQSNVMNPPKHMRYDCSFCARKFVQKSDKVVHERVHTGERPYKCKYCNKGFTQKGAVVVHTRIHTGEKPFQCQYCAKSFSDKSNKVRHERVHTGETPYICSVCNKGYKHNTQLLTHLSKHSSEAVTNAQLAASAGGLVNSSTIKESTPTTTTPTTRTTKTAAAPHRNTVNARYECSLCPKKFFRRGDLALHQQEHYSGGTASDGTPVYDTNIDIGNAKTKQKKELSRTYGQLDDIKGSGNGHGLPSFNDANGFSKRFQQHQHGGSLLSSSQQSGVQPQSLMQAVSHARERGDLHHQHQHHHQQQHEGLPLMDGGSHSKLQYMMPPYPSGPNTSGNHSQGSTIPHSPGRNAMHALNGNSVNMQQHSMMNQMMHHPFYNPMAMPTMPTMPMVNYHDFISNQRNPHSPHTNYDPSGANGGFMHASDGLKSHDDYQSLNNNSQNHPNQQHYGGPANDER